jgi:hypothetical protein
MVCRDEQGPDLAQAAEGLVGTRFRLHGRHREHGLDCLGVLAASLREIGLPGDFPTDYAWRNTMRSGRLIWPPVGISCPPKA